MMVRNNILKGAIFLLLVVLFGISCKLFLTKRVYRYAQTPVSSEQLRIYSEILDSSNIFYRTWYVSMPITQEQKSSYQCIRFLSDGRLQVASFDSIPTLKEIQNTFGSFADYYKIGDGVLKLEVYRGEFASMGYWEGRIYPDSLVFYKEANTKWKIPKVYIKTKVR